MNKLFPSACIKFIFHVETEAGLDTGQSLERVLCVPVWCPVQCSVASWASWKQCPVLLSLQVDTQPCRKLCADNSVKTTPQTNQFGSQMCGQLISVIRCTYNFLLPFSSYTLFRVVNFRCADMRLLFFQFITIKAVFKCNIQTTLHCPVSVYSRLVQVQSFASLVFGSAVMSCLLSCLLW